MIHDRELGCWKHCDDRGSTWVVERSREIGSRGWWLYGEDVHGIFHQQRLSGHDARACRVDALRLIDVFNDRS